MVNRATAVERLLSAADSLRASVDGEVTRAGGGGGLLDVAAGRVRSVSLKRALVDVVTADVPGITPPASFPLTVAAISPLLGLAESLDGSWTGAPVSPSSVKYQVASIATMITPNLNVGEKVDPAQTGAVSIGARQVFSDMVDVRVDESIALVQRGDVAAVEAALVVELQRAAEPKLMEQLSTGVAAETDLLDAISVAAGFGAPVYVLADPAAWVGNVSTLAPVVQSAPGMVVLVPVAATSTPIGSLVVAARNLRVLAGDVVRLERPDPEKLGRNVALSLEVLGYIHDVRYARTVATTP